YFGSGLNGGISVVELDPRDNFKVVSGPTKLMTANYLDHGWERSGEDNLGATMTEGFRIGPYVEGSWMTKHNGIYYLQYAAPGTVWKSYADGVYTSRSPTSGFTYAPYSPFSYKPGGFAGSAGHSGMFRDKQGNYWRVTTLARHSTAIGRAGCCCPAACWQRLLRRPTRIQRSTPSTKTSVRNGAPT